jgi:hypothetical protein
MTPPANQTPSGRLVRVFTAPTIPEGLLLKGILESDGIPTVVKGESEGPYRLGPMDLWVPEELEVQARLLLEAAAEGAADSLDPNDLDEP